MGFAAQHIIEHPPWDANTDEVAVVVAGAATGTHTIPVQCYYVIISHNGAHTTGIRVSPDVDTTTGILFGDAPADTRIGLHVVPGTVLQLHNVDGITGINVNIVRFYNTPG